MTRPLSDFNPPPGVALPLGEGVRRIVAPNASPMTHRGTNTYLLGHAQVAVIDPGPDDPQHLRAILKATNGGASVRGNRGKGSRLWLRAGGAQPPHAKDHALTLPRKGRKREPYDAPPIRF
ncbi:MAG: hypothetical protein GDA40_08270 [Rhodobacteraceae bacterium]|nr:hypothetical protein [Paracoccaceae bacterium]